jgi:F-type H+-transporting ATPase subunit b
MNINLTLFGQMVSFALFVWFTMKYIWPPIVKALEERQAQIAEGLATAERGRHEQELARKRARDTLQKAKAQTAEMIGLAQKRATEILEEAKVEARAEGERLLTTAHAEIERERNRMKDQLREQVGQLALAAAERILQQEIDATKHKELLDAVARQI